MISSFNLRIVLKNLIPDTMIIPRICGPLYGRKIYIFRYILKVTIREKRNAEKMQNFFS